MSEPCTPAELSLSVCICVYNGAGRIGAVLEALGAQTNHGPQWEVLVIDNASTDGTSAVVSAAFAAHLSARGRLLRQEQNGLMRAREMAAQEARGEVIVFVDDDNIPAPDYVERALDIMKSHPEAGVVGGRVEADWVGEPTPLGVAVAGAGILAVQRARLRGA